MKKIKLSENIIVRLISNKGGVNRTTTCPYCDAKIGLEFGTMSKHPFCGHVEKLWEADSRWYIKFNQYKQESK